MKKYLSVFLVLALVLAYGLSGALADTTVTKVDLSGLYYPALNTSVDMIYARTSHGSGYAIYDLNGNIISADDYADITANSYGFTVTRGDSLHSKGFVNAAGTELVPTAYADVDVYSESWQVGVCVVAATSDNYDYSASNWSTGDKYFYLMDHVDIYFNGKFIGELGRSQYTDNSTAHGDYLYVKDRDGKWHYYNSSFVESGYDPTSGSGEYDYQYQDRTYIYYHKGSGQRAFAEGCTLTASEVERNVIEINGVLYDLQGNTIATLQYEYVASFSNGYARVKNKQGLYGLINDKGEELIPCIYEDLSYDGPCCGYISAVKDGKQGFVKLSDGTETCFNYAEASAKVYGVFAFLQDLDGSTIVETAAGGVLQSRYTDNSHSYSSPVVILQNSDGNCGVIGMFGEEVLPFSSQYDKTYDLTMSRDGRAILGNDGILYVIDYDYDQNAASGDGSWICPSCGSVNQADFSFCPKDGKPRP